METLSARPQLRLLLDHLATIQDTRQSWEVAYPLREVLFLVVCGTIASGDDYDDIVDWGEAHLSFLQQFSEFHFGIPCADWLRTVMNRIDPELFGACFSAGGGPAQNPRGAATPVSAGRRPCIGSPRPPPPAGPGSDRRKIQRDHRHPGT